MTPTLVPVAQYLRMSKDHQQYSLDNGTGWLAECPKPERKRTVLLALLDQQNDSVAALFLVQRLPLSDRHIRIQDGSDFLRSGKRLSSIAEFLEALKHFKRK